jgi:hypothetical protein
MFAQFNFCWIAFAEARHSSVLEELKDAHFEMTTWRTAWMTRRQAGQNSHTTIMFLIWYRLEFSIFKHFSSVLRWVCSWLKHTIGVPQQGHRRLRSRQARVHGALLQRQGQVSLLLLSFLIPMIFSFVSGFELKICYLCCPCAGYGTSSSPMQRRMGSSCQAGCMLVCFISSLGVFCWPHCHVLFSIVYKTGIVCTSSSSP